MTSRPLVSGGSHHSHFYSSELYELSYPKGCGKLAMMSRPDSDRLAPEDNKQLDSALSDLQQRGYATLVSLVEPHEFNASELDDFAAAVHSNNLIWLHLPIRNSHVPDAQFEAKWQQIGPLLHRQLCVGSSIAFHCDNDFGRSGMSVARLLIEAGTCPGEALTSVLSHSPKATPSQNQATYLLKQSWNPLAQLTPES